METHLIGSDFHIPQHSKRAVELFISFIRDLKPDKVHILGDFLDFTDVSSYLKDPYNHITIQEELEVGKIVLDSIQRTAVKANPKAQLIYYEGNHECFDDSTEILTVEGWKHHSEITLNTVLGTYDRDKDIVEWERPLAIQRFDHDGELNRIKSRNNDLLITDNHRIYYKTQSSKNNKWRTEPFSKLHVGSNRVVLKSSVKNNKADCKLTDDEIRIAGWLLTDAGNSNGRITFYQRKSKAHLILDVLNNLGWEYSTTERNRDVTEIAGRVLKKKPETSLDIRLLGIYHEKAIKLVENRDTLPEWLAELSERQFDILLSTLVDGDGSKHKSHPETAWMLYKPLKWLTGLQTYCFLNGYRTNIYCYRDTDYRMNITKNREYSLYNFNKYVSKENYKGIIWDVTTPNDTVIVRRNNTISITGNCRLQKYLANNAKELATLRSDSEYILSIPHLLDLRKRKIKYVPYPRALVLNGVAFIHGEKVRAKAGFTAHGNMDKYGMSGVNGHVHRLALVSKRLHEKNYFWMETGCLCSLNPDYCYKPDWDQGFAVVQFDKGNVYPQLIRITNNSFVYGSKVYK